MENKGSIVIVGRRWFQKSAGNTYHTVEIFMNGSRLTKLPIAYGYGDHFRDRAIGYLKGEGWDLNRFNIVATAANIRCKQDL